MPTSPHGMMASPGEDEDCEIDNRTTQGTCPHCFLPTSIGETMFHVKEFAKDCKFKVILKFFGLAWLKLNTTCNAESLYSYDKTGILNLWTAFVAFAKGNK